MKNRFSVVFLTMLIVLTSMVPTFAHKVSNKSYETAGVSDLNLNDLEYKYLTSEEEIRLKKQTYQEIMDKINKEYGTEVRFCTEEELEYLRLYVDDESYGRIMDIPLDEYEERLRTYVEESIKSNIETLEALSKYNEEDFTDWKPINRIGIQSDTKFYYETQKITGATAHLEAVVGMDSSAWRFNEINDTYTSYVPSVNGNIGFAAESYGYSLQNGDRKCTVRYRGYTFDRYGQIIDTNVYRDANFTAF